MGLLSYLIATPEHLVLAGNMCETASQIRGQCLHTSTGWGWPVAFIVDNLDISVINHPGEEDHFSPGFLAVDILFYFAVLTLLSELSIRFRRR